MDWDLIVKPFHQKGAVVSLREFTNNAMNHHHGMQSVERFGAGTDPYTDGVTVGDITAATLFQALLPAPRQVGSRFPARLEAAERGETVFSDVGCDGCHVKPLTLETRWFTEPNPYNPSGNLTPADVETPTRSHLVARSKSNLVRPLPGGKVSVKAYTDLKRHYLNDEDYDHFANEQVPQGTWWDSPTQMISPSSPGRGLKGNFSPASCGTLATPIPTVRLAT